ncbi:flavodoxin family protein [Nocardia tengchongensis]|uniref:flavodoxin family protein n=1 Tax=Nocardia tengchongensis TaxID=2055889 RepID=UPI0036937D2F
MAVNGSHRIDGLTGQVLATLGQAAAARGVGFDVIHLTQHLIQPCGRCGDCNTRRIPCEQKGDDVAGLVERIQGYAGIIYATPVYGFGMSGLMQTFVERAGVGYLRFERPLANKVAGVVVTGRRYSHDRVYGQLVDNVLLNRMIIAGSGFPAFVQGQFGGDPGADGEGMASAMLTLERMIDLLSVLLLPHNGPDEVRRRLASLPHNERAALEGLPGQPEAHALLTAGSEELR